MESEPSNFKLSRGEEGEVTITFKKKETGLYNIRKKDEVI